MSKRTYIGNAEVLKGKTALVRESDVPGTVLAQFDDLSLGLGFTHTWLMFKASEFVGDIDDDI